jgi:hypothetical protein
VSVEAVRTLARMEDERTIALSADDLRAIPELVEHGMVGSTPGGYVVTPLGRLVVGTGLEETGDGGGD